MMSASAFLYNHRNLSTTATDVWGTPVKLVQPDLYKALPGELPNHPSQFQLKQSGNDFGWGMSIQRFYQTVQGDRSIRLQGSENGSICSCCGSEC